MLWKEKSWLQQDLLIECWDLEHIKVNRKFVGISYIIDKIN